MEKNQAETPEEKALNFLLPRIKKFIEENPNEYLPFEKLSDLKETKMFVQVMVDFAALEQGREKRTSMTPGGKIVTDERRRQVEKEGWTPQHDDEHDDESLAIAASIYATPTAFRDLVPYANALSRTGFSMKPSRWPWESSSWKSCPHDRIRELAKAGALIIAEIDRLKRIPKPNQ